MSDTVADIYASDEAAVDAESTEAPEVEEGTDAAGADAPDAEPKEQKERRPRGWLESDVKTITDRFVTGEVTLDEGQHLTPHRIARLVKDLDGLDAPPSTGAVAAVLNRWVALGFIEVNDKPFAFKDYSDEGRELGLTALKERRSQNLKEQRAADKAAAGEAQPEPSEGN